MDCTKLSDDNFSLKDLEDQTGDWQRVGAYASWGEARIFEETEPGRKMKNFLRIFLILQWPATGVSGQPGADVRLDVEDLRAGGEFVTTLRQVMEAPTVEGNCLRARRETALNVKIAKITLSGFLLKVSDI